MGYFVENARIIEEALETVSEKDFEKLLAASVKTLKSGHKIVASGLGKNVPICDKFVGTMSSLGLDSYFLHTNSAVHGDIGVVKDGDLVIILTKSGSTAESVYLTKLLKQRNVDLWLLSFEEESVLTKEIENQIIVKMEHEGDMWNIMPNNSTTINLIILQTLAMEIAKNMNLTLDDFKKNHPGGHIGEVLRGKE